MSSSHQPKFLYGINSVLEALQAGKSIDRIYVLAQQANPRRAQLRQLALQRGVPVQNVPEVRLHRLAGSNHQGVVALLSFVTYCTIDQIVDQCYAQGEDPLLLICDRITDVRNIGAMARTAYAAGVHGLIVPWQQTAALNAEAVKASAGALMHMPIGRERSLVQAIRTLRLHGVQTIAADPRAERLIRECDFTAPIAILLGSEGSGITASLLRLCDDRFRLPMRRPFESYNVSASAAMILYEVMRQRGY